MRKYPTPKQFKPKNPEKYVGDVNNIVCRSGIEHRYFKYFDENPSVLKYSSEEVIVPYVNPFDKKVHRYFPDFIVMIQDVQGNKRKYMIEIKPTSDTIPPKPTKNKKSRRLLTEVVTWEVNQAKWKAAKKFCEKHSMQFLVLTEKEIQFRF